MSMIIGKLGVMAPAVSSYLVPEEAFFSPTWLNVDVSSDADLLRFAELNGVLVSKSEQLLQAIADALWGEGADTPWNPDTVQAIADAIKVERPDLVASRIALPF